MDNAIHYSLPQGSLSAIHSVLRSRVAIRSVKNFFLFLVLIAITCCAIYVFKIAFLYQNLIMVSKTALKHPAFMLCVLVFIALVFFIRYRASCRFINNNQENIDYEASFSATERQIVIQNPQNKEQHILTDYVLQNSQIIESADQIGILFENIATNQSNVYILPKSFFLQAIEAIAS